MPEPLRPDIVERLARLRSDEVQAIITSWPEEKPAPKLMRRPVPRPKPDRGRVYLIQAIVCDVWNIPIEAMASERRSREWSWPRQAAMRLAYVLAPGMSLPKVGHLFGGRDHTTVLHAKLVVEDRLTGDFPQHDDFRYRYRLASIKCRLALDSQA